MLTQQNSYSISHLLGTVTTQCLDSDSVVTIFNCHFRLDVFQFTVTLYNPLARLVNVSVRVPVNGNTYQVTDPDGKPVSSQVCVHTVFPVYHLLGRVDASCQVKGLFNMPL